MVRNQKRTARTQISCHNIQYVRWKKSFSVDDFVVVRCAVYRFDSGRQILVSECLNHSTYPPSSFFIGEPTGQQTWHYQTLHSTKRRHDGNSFARQFILSPPSFHLICHSGISRPSNQSQHLEMKAMLAVFNVCALIAVIQSALTDIPSPIEGAEADLTVPAVLRLRGK